MQNFFDENKSFESNILLIADTGEKTTYGDLSKYAADLKKVTKTRSLIFCLTSNSIGSILGYLAFLKNGDVPVLLNCDIEDGLIDNLLALYLPEYIYAPTKRKFADMEVVSEAYGYVLMKTNFTNHFELNDDLALCLTTSGSTGSPKFVRQSYQNIAYNAWQISEYLELDDSERPITTLPMNYTYGLSIINSHVLVGATILVTDKSILQKEFWDFFKDEGATSFGGVPYNYEMLDKLRFHKMKLPSLRYMTQAGGKLSPELHKKFAETAELNQKKFIVMYGQCEATARMSYLPYDKSVEKYGSVGIAIPGGKFTIVDEEGKNITESGVVGELVYEGKNVTLGYAEGGADLVKGDERYGRLMTGDMAQYDDEGYIYIKGRKKRFLKIYGNRVNLDEIESLIKVHFDYLQCACCGWDDNLYIFITDENLTKAVNEYIENITHLNHTAINVRVVAEIPKNDSGKTLYNKLENMVIINGGMES